MPLLEDSFHLSRSTDWPCQSELIWPGVLCLASHPIDYTIVMAFHTPDQGKPCWRLALRKNNVRRSGCKALSDDTQGTEKEPEAFLAGIENVQNSTFGCTQAVQEDYAKDPAAKEMIKEV
jgi:hypothetical protein